MASQEVQRTPVAIAGGGPVGLMLALFLDQYGVRSVVFNSEPEVRRHPKGSTHNARTMEHHRQLGIAPQVRNLSLPINRPTRRDCLRRGDDRVGIDAVVTIEIGDRAGLAEVLYTQRSCAMSMHRAEPTERRRMAVKHCDERAVGRHIDQQLFHMRAGMRKASLARPHCRRPASVQSVG